VLTNADKQHAFVRQALIEAARQATRLDDLGAVLHDARIGGYTVGQYSSAWLSYAAACAATSTPTTPVTLGKLSGWAVWYVVVRGLSSGSLSGVKSRIKMSCYAYGLPWLSPAHDVLLRDNIKAVRTAFPRPVDQRRALRVHHLESVRVWLLERLRHEPWLLLWAAQVWAMLVVGHQGLLRPREYTDGNLRRVDVTELGVHPVSYPFGAYQLRIVGGKTDKVSKDGMSVVLKGTGTALCPVAALRRYLQLAAFFPEHGRCALFPALATSGNVTAAYYSGRLWRFVVRTCLHRAGVREPWSYSGRSLRYGGCIDMLLAGNGMDVVLRLGRWKSSAMLDLYSQQMGVGVLGLMK
jgi:hypothetical protein